MVAEALAVVLLAKFTIIDYDNELGTGRQKGARLALAGLNASNP